MTTYSEAQAAAIDEIYAILQATDLGKEKQIEALSKALELATPVAYGCGASQAIGDGQFLTLLIELVKLLLPILLELMKDS